MTRFALLDGAAGWVEKPCVWRLSSENGNHMESLHSSNSGVQRPRGGGIWGQNVGDGVKKLLKGRVN